MISIIIPMRNEAAYVGRCLDSILAQTAGRQDVEILCVDGDSSDGTPAIVGEYSQRDPRVRFLHNPARIVPVAMNLGIREARGEIIIRLDCHAEYAPDYVANCAAVLQRTGADNVGGYVTTLPGRDAPIGRAIAAATSSRFGVGGSVFRVGGDEQEADTVPFGCFRREVFDRFGLYDERLVRNQDIELNSRIRRHGGRVLISPQIRLTYFNRSTFSGLRQQAFHNGLWNAYTLFLVGGGLRWRHFIPLGFVLAILALTGGGFLWQPCWWALAGLLIVYLTAGLAASVSPARAAKTSTLLVLLAFVQLHLSYGLGTLVGLIGGPFRMRRRTEPPQALADRRD